jgi:hypothetical protein
MHRTTLIMASLAVVAFGAFGCSSSTSPSGDGGSGGTCDTSKTVSFKTDVVPIIQGSCSLSTVCHGTVNNSMAESLYLGPNLEDAPNGFSAAQATASIAAVVGVKAKENPMMNMVTASDLENSFLWHKIVGDMNSDTAVAAGCMTTDESCAGCSSTEPCGKQMPYLSTVLAADEQCKFKSWIVQGALDN